MDNKSSYILVTGDFYGGDHSNPSVEGAKINFNDFEPIIKESSLAITNLESPVIESKKIRNEDKIAKTGPHIYSHPGIVKTLNQSGFKLVTLANNHIMDLGLAGLNNTLDELKKHSVGYIGAGLSEKERRRPFIYEHKNKRIAILNFCENEWSTSSDEQPGANPLDFIANFEDITEQKKNSDFVIVIFHGGNELYNLPSPQFRDTCRLLIHYGADYVICHHTHTYSGYEHYNNGYIFYGLGNFYFPTKKSNPQDPWYYGFALKMFFDEQHHKFELIPYYQNAYKDGIRLLNSSEVKAFHAKIAVLNKIIGDDAELNKAFEAFTLKVSKQYLAYLQPFDNKYVNGLINRGLLPSLLSKRKLLLLLNLLRCESHHTLIKQLLKNITKV